jgi:hypothetical protein
LVEDQEDEIVSLKAGLLAGKGRLGVLEMLLVTIHLRVQVLEEAMETDSPSMDLTSEDSDYQEFDDGGVMLVEDLEDEGNEEKFVPILVPAPWVSTPFPGVVLNTLIPIEDPAPVVPSIDVDTKGEDDAWYIPPVFRHQVYHLDEYSMAHVDPVPDYVEDVREDPMASPQGQSSIG